MRHLKILIVLICIFYGSRSQGQETGQRRALLIGVSKYERAGFSSLKYPEEDVKGIDKELRKAGFKTTLMLSSHGDSNPLRATRANIERQLQSPTEYLAQKKNDDSLKPGFIASLADLKKSDLVLVVLAGHGRQELVVNNETKRKESAPFFCPTDANRSLSHTWISINKLMERISDYSGSEKNLILIDACRDNPSRGRGIDGKSVSINVDNLAICFSSSAGTESYESDQLKHGIFSHFVIEGLKGKAVNFRRQVTWNSLTGYVQMMVSEQAPQLIEREQSPHIAGSLKAMPVLIPKVRDAIVNKGSAPNEKSESTEKPKMKENAAELAAKVREQKIWNAAIELDIRMNFETVGTEARLVEQLASCIKKNDYAGASRAIQSMRYSDTLAVNKSLDYFEGLSLFHTKNFVDSKKSLERYVKNSTLTAKHYDKANSLLKRLDREFLPGITITNSIGMKLISIPKGDFMMGSHERIADKQKKYSSGYPEENPLHHVVIDKEIYFGIYEVTIGQFRAFVKDTGYKTEAETSNVGGQRLNPTNGDMESYAGANWKNPGYSDQFKVTDNLPVTQVSWNDAQKFVIWLGKKEGKKYRLPTEAEWEYACRAGSTSVFSDGNTTAALRRNANFFDLSAKKMFKSAVQVENFDDGHVFVAPVGLYLPNKFGLFDMHGNVWEWCYDSYVADYYLNSKTKNPFPSKSETLRIMKGGCYI